MYRPIIPFNLFVFSSSSLSLSLFLSHSDLSLVSCYQRLMVRWDFSSSLHILVICVCVGWIGLYARMSKHKGLSGYTAQILSLNIEYKSVSHLFIIHVGCYKFEIFIHSILNQDMIRSFLMIMNKNVGSRNIFKMHIIKSIG